MKRRLKLKKLDKGYKLTKTEYFSKKERKKINKLLKDINSLGSFKIIKEKRKHIIIHFLNYEVFLNKLNYIKTSLFFINEANIDFFTDSYLNTIGTLFEHTRSLNHKPMIITQSIRDIDEVISSNIDTKILLKLEEK